MIFQKTIDQVLKGTKSQTCRLQHNGDTLIVGIRGLGVYDRKGRPRWVIGGTYAVQPKRCEPAKARIRITGIWPIYDVLGAADEAFAKLEGFESAEAFRESWTQMHQRHKNVPAWVLRFELVEARP
jgi:hypothetical protein